MKHFVPFLIAVCAAPVWADAPDVTDVKVTANGDSFRIDVTIAHPDTGWDHYADGWEVLAPDGTRLGMRELAHPHVEEQPFTRSLTGVVIPDGVASIMIRTRCNVDGWSAETVTVALP
ncbi:hypothetical protein [Octadecabacter sp. R77987]|uniref:hypothetical protein n=1 Tax=Octadecabacter sp. R77987 TaxID=3093874 RepID=UPI0036720F25